jgi:outer membrane protein OmpA-like peptidoglycan-associated protein
MGDGSISLPEDEAYYCSNTWIDAAVPILLYFDPGEPVPIPDAEPVLAAIAGLAEGDATVSLRGYCDEFENSSLLSLRRARHVADELERLGVRKAQILVEGLGAKDLIPESPGEAHPGARSRRVIIVVKRAH